MTAIKTYIVYTPKEVQELLKISRRTFLRLIQKKVIRANKIGGQYRILGSELLRLLDVNKGLNDDKINDG